MDCVLYMQQISMFTGRSPCWLGSVLCNSMRGGTTGNTIYRQDLCTLLSVGRYGGCVGVCGAEEYYFDIVVSVFVFCL